MISYSHDIDRKWKGSAHRHGSGHDHGRGAHPSEEERADMIVSLKAAETRIAARQCAEHDPDTFVDRLVEIRAAAISNKKA
jgi:hypothetical protein